MERTGRIISQRQVVEPVQAVAGVGQAACQQGSAA